MKGRLVMSKKTYVLALCGRTRCIEIDVIEVWFRSGGLVKWNGTGYCGVTAFAEY